jgi:hypothetical protein
MSNGSERLQKAALFAEIIGALAVVISLLFVGFQLSRSTAEAIGASHHQLIALLNGNDDWLKDPVFADTLLRAEQDRDAISDSEFLQVASWVGQRLTVCENVYQRRDDGLVDDDMWPAWAAGCADVLVSNSTARVVWEERKSWFANDFATWLEREAGVDQ